MELGELLSEMRTRLMPVMHTLEDSKRGHIIPKKERSEIDATGGSATYGEVMPEGIQAIVDKLALTSDDVFMGASGVCQPRGQSFHP